MASMQELVERYKQFRQVGMELNRTLVRCLDKDAIQQGGQQLGIWKHGTLVFETEDESGVLMDHCIHVLRKDGRNTVERFLADSPPPEGSDERIYLEALAQGRHSMFSVGKRIPGVGVEVYDLMAEHDRFLFDIAFSQSAEPGSVLAARVFAPEGISMTTGTALPVHLEAMKTIAEQIDEYSRKHGIRRAAQLSREDADGIATIVTRTLLAHGSMTWIRYQNVAETEPEPARDRSLQTRRRPVGRNEPCPCGSGKLFKRCCGAL